MDALADERPHEPPEGVADFHESWYVDFSRDDGTGGYLMLSLVPGEGVAWCWAFLVAPDVGLVAVRDHEVPLPRGDLLEVRAEGLWAEMVCETPMEHWGFGLEAFGLRYDDPADAYRGEVGERLAVGVDLEWEATTPRYDYPFPSELPAAHYEHAGVVHGELLVGRRRIDFEGRGSRDHSWGARDWWGTAWHWSAFQVNDRLAVSFVQPEGMDDLALGAVWRLGEDFEAITSVRLETHLGPEGIPTAARYVIDHEMEVDVEVLAPAPILLVAPDGRASRVPRALCRYSTPEGVGTGWAEWNQPAAG